MCFPLVVILLDCIEVSQTSPSCIGSRKCCAGYQWNEMEQTCVRCFDGYVGKKCEIPCPYPGYGQTCQQICRCNEDTCNHVYGCVYNQTNSSLNTQKPTGIQDRPESQTDTVQPMNAKGKPGPQTDTVQPTNIKGKPGGQPKDAVSEGITPDAPGFTSDKINDWDSFTNFGTFIICSCILLILSVLSISIIVFLRRKGTSKTKRQPSNRQSNEVYQELTNVRIPDGQTHDYEAINPSSMKQFHGVGDVTVTYNTATGTQIIEFKSLEMKIT